MDISPPTKEQIRKSRKILADLTARDAEKKLLEKSRNELETFLYETSEKFYDELYEKCSTEEERDSVRAQLSESSDWLYEQDDDANKEVFINKLKDLKKLTKNLELRVAEAKERPQAMAALNSMLNHSQFFLVSLKNLSEVETDPIFTPIEVEMLAKLVNDTETWKTDMLKEQENTPNYEKPKLLVEDIATKIRALDREVKYLINKAKSFKPKSKPKPAKSKSGNKTETVIDGDSVASNETKESNTGETTAEGGERASPDDGVETELPPPPTDSDSPVQEDETVQQQQDGQEDTQDAETTTKTKSTEKPKETNTHDAGDL